eukprot:7196764-Prymnesium_polylepis.1
MHHRHVCVAAPVSTCHTNACAVRRRSLLGDRPRRQATVRAQRDQPGQAIPVARVSAQSEIRSRQPACGPASDSDELAYSSIPQSNPHLQQMPIATLPVYASNCRCPSTRSEAHMHRCAKRVSLPAWGAKARYQRAKENSDLMRLIALMVFAWGFLSVHILA